MSEDRTIKSLKPRVRKPGAAANLDASQRKLHATEPTEPEPVTEVPVVEKLEEKPAAKKQTKRPAKTPTSSAKPAKAQIAVFVPAELRGRARAAFKYANFHEDVSSFTDLVANALEAEVHRIEIAYNNGNPFEPAPNQLPSGRPAARTE